MELERVVDELHGVDLGELTDAEIEDLAVGVDRQAARLTAEHARILAAVEARRTWAADGSRSCAAWLARKRNGSRARASGALRFGQSLERMPRVATALAAGDIGIEHARELASCLRFKPDVFGEAEEELLHYAQVLRWRDFVRVCAAWRDAVDPDGADRRADAVYDARHLILHSRPDGALLFQSGLMDAMGAAAFLDELGRLERQFFEDDWAEARLIHGDDVKASDLRRTNAQRRLDALVEMAYRSRTAPADGKRPDPLVTVYVDYETVTGRLCELASGVPVTPGQLLPVFTRADIERIVFGPRNRIIELGERDRFFTGGLRRAIQLRDRHCQFPGCTVPAHRCEVDHVVEYAKGGLTTQENGRLGCGTHNRGRNRQPWPGEADPPAVDVDHDDVDPPETDAEIERQHRRCRARLRQLVPAAGHPPPKRPPPWSPTARMFFTDPT
jgi:hypothetical protein